MPWNRALTDLQNALADLYEDQASASRLVDEAGLDASRISLGSSARNNWHAILEEADRQRLVDALAAIAAQEFPRHEGLGAARVAYAASMARDGGLKPAWEGNPYPGLRPLEPKDAAIYFGRDRDADELVARVRESRFVAVVGASGSGKSSLVWAGLIPRLHGGAIPGSGDWPCSRFTPGEMGDDPFLSLATALRCGAQRPIDLAERLRAQPEALEELCGAPLGDKPAGAELLLFLDQLEELFTVSRPDRCEPFVRLLARLAAMDRLRIVATVRADFYHECVKYGPLARLLRSGSFPLSAPGLGALYEMITRPAALAGLRFEGDLPDRILRDTGSEPGALALMAYTLDRLYSACVPSGKRLLSLDAYDKLGRVQGAIGARAQQVFERLGRPAQEVLPAVFRELVEVDERGTATRQRAPRRRVTGTPEAAALVEELTKERLLVQNEGEEDGQPMVEVAHEAIFRSWPALAQWIEERQDDLRLRRQVHLAAIEWQERGNSEDYLWTGTRLQQAQAMVQRLQPELSDAERAFLRSEVERLEEKLADPALGHPARARIGERLLLIGDTRPGVGLRPDGLPDIVWCPVPGGRLRLEGQGNKLFTVRPFHIARYPITYAQFQAFVDAPDGFRNAAWWRGLAKREKEPGEQRFRFDNHPRDNVSWYAAVAFCRWLTARLPAEAWPPPLADEPVQARRDKGSAAQPAVLEIRLPTEWEWQQAATGGDPDREYPWGPQWDGLLANTWESGLSRTIAVGMYPQGASPVGALDMSGNVWEWCLNGYDEPAHVALAGELGRAARGGSWLGYQDGARCACRRGYDPDDLNYGIGFRVVCARPPIS